MYLTLALITIVLSAFFSGIEIAFVSSNKLQLELDKGSENISSKVIAFFSKNESNFITTMLIGNNISLVIYGIVMTKILSPYLDFFQLNSYLLLFVQTRLLECQFQVLKKSILERKNLVEDEIKTIHVLLSILL